MPHLKIAAILEDLVELKKMLFSDDWNESLDAADKLAEINSSKSIAILIEGIKSENNLIRNSAALGIRELRNNEAYKELWKRILELGPNGEVGTLVYSMEFADCSKYLSQLVNLFKHGNYEVQNMTHNIIYNQVFYVSENEYIRVKDLLVDLEFDFDDIKIEIIKNEA